MCGCWNVPLPARSSRHDCPLRPALFEIASLCPPRRRTRLTSSSTSSNLICFGTLNRYPRHVVQCFEHKSAIVASHPGHSNMLCFFLGEVGTLKPCSKWSRNSVYSRPGGRSFGRVHIFRSRCWECCLTHCAVTKHPGVLCRGW